MPDFAKFKSDLFIAGKWQNGSRPERIEVIDPATGNVLTTIADASPEDGIRAIDAAEAAAKSWAKTPPRQRGEILRKAFELMMARHEELAQIIAYENGKALPDARGEVAYAAEFFRWFSEEAVRLNGELYMAPSGSNRIMVEHQPIGISVMITPWNFPAAMATRKIGPALAAGCTVVLKPATETPLTAYAIAEILAEAGVPDGVVNVVTTSTAGKVIGAMLADQRVRKLSFTGSTEVGKVLLKTASENIISCAMELGGNAPFVVFDDADIDAAVEGAMIAKMRNGGEACTAANRLYVQRGVADEFARKLAAKMGEMKIGPGYEDGVTLGPLVNEASREKVIELVTDAVDKGAEILTGGHSHQGPGYFYDATVLTRVPKNALVLSEEIFGPVAPVIAFDTEEEAIALSNETEYGLVAYVFTGDLARGLRVSEGIDAGMIALNRGLVSDPAAPFGGMKQSGIGREGAHVGLMEFTETKYIATNW